MAILHNSLIINQLGIIQKYMYNPLIFNKQFSVFFAKSLGILSNISYLCSVGLVDKIVLKILII